MRDKTEELIKYEYQHIKKYLNEDEGLKKLCINCENYCGKQHNYEECKNSICFKYYLAYKYLDLVNSY